MFVDPEFKSLDEKVVNTTLNTTGSRDHVTEVERQIQVIKECMQAHHTNLPFPSFTGRMTIDLAKHVVMFLNSFPPKSVLSKTYSPSTIMTGKTLDWKKSYKLHFVAYALVHEDRNAPNTLEERTQEAICLGPIGKLQGTYNFFSLRSGKNITRGQLTEVPTPMIVMKRVAAMALAQKQNKGLIFEKPHRSHDK